ncbi:MAG: GHKL domain-containing protein [Ruminococcus sp.]|nr:GHKL domain-containing protein [Ruminococcus sp.]
MTENVALVGLFLIFFWHVLFMSRLGEPKFPRRKNFVIWLISMVVMLLTGYVLMYTVGMNMGAPILTILVMIVAMTVFFITSADPFPKKFFLLVTYYNFFYMMLQSGFLISAIFYEPDTEPYQILSIIVRNIIQLIAYLLYFKFVHPKLRAVNVRRNSEWWYLSVISVLFTVIFITQAMFLNRVWLLPTGYTPVFAAIFIQGIATSLVVFRTISYMDKNAETVLMEQNMKLLSEQVDRLMESEDETRSLRHDMNGHLATVSALLRENKTDEAVSYLDGVTELHAKAKNEPFSNNPYMNAVLNEYKAKCGKNGISFICRIGADNYSLPAAELCLILNNALENAFEATMKLPQEERYIKVQASVRQKRFLLRISNRYDGEILWKDGLPATVKEGKEHGYGLANICRAVQSKGGMVDCRAEKGYFVLDVQFRV